MAPGDSASIHLSSNTNGNSAGTYDNTATAQGTNTTQVSDDAQIVVLPAPLTITKTHERRPVWEFVGYEERTTDS